MTAASIRLAESTIRWLEETEPGLELAGWLMAHSDARLSGYDRVVALRAHQRTASHYAAQFCQTWRKSAQPSLPRTA